LCAFVITLEEMRHHFPTGNRAVRESFQRAVVITMLLAAAGALLAVMMPRLAGVRTQSESPPGHQNRAARSALLLVPHGVANDNPPRHTTTRHDEGAVSVPFGSAGG
jgi:hypothetical protein